MDLIYEIPTHQLFLSEERIYNEFLEILRNEKDFKWGSITRYGKYHPINVGYSFKKKDITIEIYSPKNNNKLKISCYQRHPEISRWKTHIIKNETYALKKLIKLINEHYN